MKTKLIKSLKRDHNILKMITKIYPYNVKKKFIYKVSLTKKKYIQMLKQKYISCLVNLNKDQIYKGIKEIESFYPNKIIFYDILICIKYKN